MDNEKSKAEQYRDERKERIAKSAKKNANKIEKNSTVKKIIGRVVSIVIAAAIVIVALGYCLSYYGVPQRLVSIGGVGNDQHVSVAEYEYYYMQAYNQLTYYAQYYSYYGYDYGYDTTLTPEAQTKTTTDEDGNEITWSEYLHEQTVSMAQMYKAYYNEAVKADLKLTEEDEANIDNTIQDYKDRAQSGGSSDTSTTSENTVKYSLNAYLRKLFGGSVNKHFLRKQLEIQALAQKYYQNRTDELAESYKQDEIDKAYNDDKGTYDVVDFRLYTFTNESLQAADGESDADLAKRQATSDAKTKSDAQTFYDAVKDEATFVSQAKALNAETADYDVEANTRVSSALKENIKSNYSEDLSNWLFAGTTKVGEKKMVTDTDNGKYFIAVVTALPHQVDTVNVRHILFKTVDDDNKALSDDEIAKAKQNAEEALKTWQEGKKTEDSFAAIANDLSEDDGSNTNGGLNENILPGQTVSAFDKWCFDESRQAGDVEIIETEYGYHVMYFVSKNGEYYNTKIRNDKASADIEKEATDLLDGDTYVAGFGPRRLAYAEKRVTKKIQNLVELNNANSASSASSSAATAS